MSILLDALRKSEQRERLGVVPDIHATEATAGRRSRPRWLSPVVAVLFLALMLAAGYLAWRWWAATVAVDGLEAGTGTVASQPAEPGVAVPASGEATAAANDAPPLNRQPRSPVETLSGDRPHRPASAAGARAPAARPAPGGDTGSSQGASTDSTIAQSDVQRADDRPSSDLADAVSAAAESAPPAAAPPARPAPRQAGGRDEDAGTISYWQMPDYVRENLPPFKINVMVFDEDPARRFIIMGGERLREGADLGNGLYLREIQRDRVIFRSGVYRFYVTQ